MVRGVSTHISRDWESFGAWFGLGSEWRGTVALGAFALRCLLVLKERERGVAEGGGGGVRWC